MWKSSQEWSVQRSAVRSIAWLGLCAIPAGDPPKRTGPKIQNTIYTSVLNAIDAARGWRVSSNQRALKSKSSIARNAKFAATSMAEPATSDLYRTARKSPIQRKQSAAMVAISNTLDNNLTKRRNEKDCI